MTPIKDVSDLYLADPENFVANVERMRRQAISGSEWLARHAGDRRDAAAGNVSDEHTPLEPSIFNPEAARVTLARLDAPPEPPRFVVERLLPPAAGVLNGPGGTGKTSLVISECAHIILGHDLYGREVLRPGAVLYVTQEDSDDKLIYILSRIIGEMDLSPGERERVAGSFYIEDLENRRTRFVESDRNGNLSPTDVADQLIDQYIDRGVSLVVIDPLIFFSPGERHLNDGASELLLVGRRISRALECCVQFVHHCSIATSRDKTNDQYAGRSAAAIADNSRFVRNLYRYASADGNKFGADPPASVTTEDIALQRLLVLTSPKISDAPPATEPIWVRREGWSFTHVENEHRSRDEVDRELARRVCDFVTAEEKRGVDGAEGVWHTENTLTLAHKDFGLTRDRMIALLNLCLQKAWLIPQEIPEGHPFRHGKRTHRLTVGLRP